MGVLVRLIRRLNDAARLTSVVVTHDVKEALEISDLMYVISDGKVVERGTPQQLAHSRVEWTRQFIDGRPDGPVPFHYPAPELHADLAGSGR
jgi:phospholipid/cholesterol/gamma-HCH transport system ATP-binding protein